MLVKKRVFSRKLLVTFGNSGTMNSSHGGHLGEQTSTPPFTSSQKSDNPKKYRNYGTTELTAAIELFGVEKMTAIEIQNELAVLLEKIGIIVDEDLKDEEPNLNGNEVISYILFIRIAEIFKSISILLSTDLDQVIPAKILLRSLAEYFILLKSSIEDDTFNDRHIKNAFLEKEKWLDKTIKNHKQSGHKQDPEFFEELKATTRNLFDEYQKCLQPAYNLFEDQEELLMYLNVYLPSSMYVHGNRQSFNIYYEEGGSVRPTSERDYSPLLRHAGLATGQIMLQSYEQFCRVLKRETLAIKAIQDLLEASAKRLRESMLSEGLDQT